jgi:hypothetical protein
MVKAPNIPQGPQGDAYEARYGSEARAQSVDTAPLHEAMVLRGNALNSLAQAKENLGAVATAAERPRVEIGADGNVISRFDIEHDGPNANQPVGVGGRAH